MESTMMTLTSTTTESPGHMLISSGFYLRIFYIIVGSLGLLGNIFVVIVIFNYTAMRKQWTNTYIINQSIVDAMVALFLILSSVMEDDERKFDSIDDVMYCKLWLSKIWLWSTLLISTYNLLAVTVERYLATVHPVWHKMKFNKTKVLLSIITVWLVSIGINLAIVLPTSVVTPNGKCTYLSHWPSTLVQRAVGILTIIVQYIFPLAVLSFCYIRMAITLRRRATSADDKFSDTLNGKKKLDNSMARASRNIIKTLAVVSFCFILCWTLNQFYFLLFSLGYKVDFTGPFYHFTVVMVFLNCCINPFIYIAKYLQFQKAVRKLFSKNIKYDVSENLMSENVLGATSTAL